VQIAEYALDRTGWPSGPWDEEPDRVEFTTAAGYPGLMRRGPMGQWCGYVAVPPGHPWHGLEMEVLDGLADCPGGVTYAAACHGEICHTPAPGESDDVWWVGFDCGHAGDLIPGMLAITTIPLSLWRHGTYKPMDWVQSAVERLAEHCAEAATADEETE